MGEYLHTHQALPYRDLYDGTAPLAAAIFAGLDALLGRPVLLYRALALALLLVQALRLNLVLNRYDVHPERGYVAALTYLLVGSVSTDLDTLSPLLLGHTFIIFGMSALLPTSREGYDNRRLFRAGLLVGLAALCYLPLGLFVLVGLFAVIIFAANAFRSFLLLLCGALFPYALLVTYLFYVGALPAFAQFHLRPGLAELGAGELPAAVQLRLLALPGLVLIAALLRSLGTSLGLVFQSKFRQLMLVWLLVALATAATGARHTGHAGAGAGPAGVLQPVSVAAGAAALGARAGVSAAAGERGGPAAPGAGARPGNRPAPARRNSLWPAARPPPTLACGGSRCSSSAPTTAPTSSTHSPRLTSTGSCRRSILTTFTNTPPWCAWPGRQAPTRRATSSTKKTWCPSCKS